MQNPLLNPFKFLVQICPAIYFSMNSSCLNFVLTLLDLLEPYYPENLKIIRPLHRYVSLGIYVKVCMLNFLVKNLRIPRVFFQCLGFQKCIFTNNYDDQVIFLIFKVFIYVFLCIFPFFHY